MKIGNRQLRLLVLLACPDRMMVTPRDSVARSLLKRGLLADDKGGTRITADGLRALAAEMDSGKVAAFLQTLEMRRSPQP